MESLKEIVTKNRGSHTRTELLCHAIEEWIIDEFAPEIQKWVIEEFAPEIQEWIIKEFSPQIEKWVKDYVMDNHTVLHIEDFCIDNKETHIELSDEDPANEK